MRIRYYMASKETVFLFGEAEKGPYRSPLRCSSIGQLYDQLGNAPPQTEGLFYALQALMLDLGLIYFRVQQEGYSADDYLEGLHLLRKKPAASDLTAIGIPGVGDAALIDAAAEVCRLYRSVLLLSEKDLYDYLTGR